MSSLSSLSILFVNCHYYVAQYMFNLGLDATKPVFGDLRTTQAQTSLASAQSDQHLCYSPTGKYHI